MRFIRLASAAAAAAMVWGAIAIGGGVPVTPQRIAAATADAARNVAEAEENTSRSARDTEALGAIARNVASQLATSQRMLGIQFRIESAAQEAARHSQNLNDRLIQIGRALRELESQLRDLSLLSTRSAGTSQAAATNAGELQTTIALLGARFDKVTDLSRRLNRKARGYGELKDGPDG